ncbi:hypothetical protein Ancab_024204 [Ancistrocladus abbreviatus]
MCLARGSPSTRWIGNEPTGGGGKTFFIDQRDRKNSPPFTPLGSIERAGGTKSKVEVQKPTEGVPIGGENIPVPGKKVPKTDGGGNGEKSGSGSGGKKKKKGHEGNDGNSDEGEPTTENYGPATSSEYVDHGHGHGPALGTGPRPVSLSLPGNHQV